MACRATAVQQICTFAQRGRVQLAVHSRAAYGNSRSSISYGSCGITGTGALGAAGSGSVLRPVGATPGKRVAKVWRSTWPLELLYISSRTAVAQMQQLSQLTFFSASMKGT